MRYSKKANVKFMLINIAKVILFLLFLAILLAIAVKIYLTLTDNPNNEMLKSQLNVFAAQIGALSYSNEDYSGMPIFLNIKPGYILLGFDSDNTVETNLGDVYKKPSSCGTGSCLCLYNYQKMKKPFYCVKINADYIFTSFLYNDLTDYKMNTKIGGIDCSSEHTKNRVLNGIINFYSRGQASQNTLEVYKYFKNKNILDKDADTQTYLLGFEKEILYDLFIAPDFKGTQAMGFDGKAYVKPPDFVSLGFYVELFKIDNNNQQIKLLLFHPYSDTIRNRKYYFIKEEGLGECKDKFLHQPIKVASGNYSYCIKTSRGLEKSEQEISACPKGKIENLCVCGNRAVSSGSCYDKIINHNNQVAKGPVISNSFLNEFTCLERIAPEKCNDYKSQFTCINNICEISGDCKWVNNKCK